MSFYISNQKKKLKYELHVYCAESDMKNFHKTYFKVGWPISEGQVRMIIYQLSWISLMVDNTKALLYAANLIKTHGFLCNVRVK
jgi:hypothetical protein